MRGLSLHHLIERRAQFLGPASISGSLVDLGGHPGARPDRTGIIRGEIYRLESVELLTALDSAEGPEFPRRLTPVRLEDGREVSAWVYWFKGSLDQGVPIPDGDYRYHVSVHPRGGI
jgi:gamma-glutamylcyclotransferase (GGCT)/AIG2-like uncharacterized protein YtfP